MLSIANKLGLRNLWRRRRRSILTWLMITVGTTLVVWSVGLAEGTYRDMIELATCSSTGHFQVLAPDYHDKPSLFRNLSESDSLAAALAGHPEVLALAPRVETAGLLAAGTRSTGTLLVGIDPEREAEVSTMAGTLSDGTWFAPVEDEEALPSILLGAGLARRLGVALGDTLSFVGQAADGSIAAELFVLEGLLKSGSEEADAAVALARMSDLQVLLALEGRVHRMVGRLVSVGRLDGLLDTVEAGGGRVLMGWPELLPSLSESIEADRNSGRVSLAIIMLMALLGVSNTMIMSVFERTREFGVMLALGTGPGAIVRAVMWESFWLSISGVVAGVAAGSIVVAKIPISMGDEPIDFGGVVLTEMHGANTMDGLVWFPLIILAAGLLAGLLPAMRAARLSPAEALSRH